MSGKCVRYALLLRCGSCIQVVYSATGEEWHISSLNAQPEAPAFFVAGLGASRRLRLGVKRVTFDQEQHNP